MAEDNQEPQTEPENTGNDSDTGEDSGVEDKPKVENKRSPQDFIIQRQQQKIEKLKQQSGAELTPLADSLIEEKIAPLHEEVEKLRFEADFRDYLGQNPEHKKYEAEARKLAGKAEYKGVPMNFLFAGLAYKDAEMLGAEKAKQADQENKMSSIGGSSIRKTTSGLPDPWSMDQKAFQDMMFKAQTGQQ